MDTFLGRALTDAATGLPNIPYFRIIQNWEERRARRRKTQVRVVRVAVRGGADGSRRALLWRLCRELRTTDLIASEGRDLFHILLTTPDAENAVGIAGRIERIGAMLGNTDPEGAEQLVLETQIEPPTEVAEQGPCDPCVDHELGARSSHTPPVGEGSNAGTGK